jgi:uncharacterized protein (DUF2267 family)
MSTTGLDVFDSTVQQTNVWLKEIADDLHWDDRRRAYIALRGTLHALRDYLVTDEAAHLAAQVPLLVRGIFYEGWDPAQKTIPQRSRDDFLGRVAAEFARTDPGVDPARVARSVLRVLSEHVAAGEIDQIRRILPEDVREIWPQAA